MRKGITLILEAVLGLLMAYVAYTLLAWTPAIVTKARDALHYPRWFWVLAAVLAVISALTLLMGLFSRVVGAFGALWTSAYLLGASATHLSRADWANFSVPLVVLLPVLLLLWLRWDDAKPFRRMVGMKTS